MGPSVLTPAQLSHALATRLACRSSNAEGRTCPPPSVLRGPPKTARSLILLTDVSSRSCQTWSYTCGRNLSHVDHCITCRLTELFKHAGSPLSRESAFRPHP